MKKYRFYYWFNAMTTEVYIRANTEQEALEKFRELKGDRKIISCEIISCDY